MSCRIFLLLILFLYSCASNNRMGKVTYSKGGTIESGSSITKCSRPEKRYTKSLEAKVQGSIDSLRKLPK